eukprot:TRINITY_DN31857_c0_g1_i1.p1 TRINITY_DN31857_c0_g1~~TRINITY_DN31857_c0_g1_i1.p1  ORF type:complete len:157 (+),score=27.35 TRINITY_DN31857_c0_g1_i1:72-542(+)
MEPPVVLVTTCVVGSIGSYYWGQHCERLLFPERCALRDEIRKLEAESEQYNTPDTFAKSSLCERKAAVKRLQLEQLPHSTIKATLRTIVWVLLEIVIPLFVSCYYSCIQHSDITIPSEWSALRFPFSDSSNISFVEFTILTLLSMRGVRKSFLSTR